MDEETGISQEEALEFSEEWFGIADTDGSGTIDLNEFYEFAKALDDKKTITQDQQLDLFKKHDADSNETLDKEEFGQALFDMLKLLRNDISEDNSLEDSIQDEEEIDNLEVTV